MYTPTKTELEELGFEKWYTMIDWIPYKKTIYLDESYKDKICIHTSNKWWFSLSQDYWCCSHSFSVEIYPRSLDHLKQIILAFNPTE